jgi:F0F1-type ATP synthase membrane subunit b/b'
MAVVTKEQKIAAAKKALEEAKKVAEDAQAQYAKAEALYNKAKVAALSIQTLVAGAAASVTGAVSGLTSTVSSVNVAGDANAAAAAGTAIGSGIGAALSVLSPEERDKQIKKYKDEARKLERKAQQELEKAKKALEGAKKRIIVIQEQLNTLFTKRTLQEKAEAKKALSKLKVKNANKKIKINKAKLKAGLKKIIKAAGPIAIVFVLGRVLNTYVTRLANTVSQLTVLVDKTNETIQAATTKADIQKAKVSRDAALATLSAAEAQVNGFRNTIGTMSRIITTITLLLSIAAALPYTPYQISPLGIRTTRTLEKFNPVLLSLSVLLQVSLATLDVFLTNIAYERSRLLPLNNVLEQADAQDLTPEEVRDLLATSSFNTGLGPVEGVVYNGFTFSIIEENDPDFVVAGNKRRYAVALDRSGFVVLQSTPSFTLDPNVLIEELKLEINKQNLEA